jgi:hypothetical protein
VDGLIEGLRVKMTATFRDETKEPFDPETVRFTVEDGDGNVVVYEDTSRVGPGVYDRQLDLTASGTWWYRNEGLDAEGNVVAVDQGPFEVASRRPFP